MRLLLRRLRKGFMNMKKANNELNTRIMKITESEISKLANDNGYKYAALRALVDVESGGTGFAQDGKIIIQFEPSWFKRKAPFAPSGLWSVNKVERQSAEWIAFNDAFSKDANAAMESTSIGMMQVMGFHWKDLKFESVGAMWDYAKINEANQVEIAIRFIKNIPKLDQALKGLNWHLVACYYNGFGYKELAKKISREPYNISLEKSYHKFKNV